MRLNKGFTLIEVLVVITIIGVLIGFASVAYRAAKISGRDTKRKADLEEVRSALEIYRSDCRGYPSSMPFGAALSGSGVCSGNTYMATSPEDPLDPTYSYRYYTIGSGYNLCAHLENDSSTGLDCDGIAGVERCGDGVCNYKTQSP